IEVLAVLPSAPTSLDFRGTLQTLCAWRLPATSGVYPLGTQKITYTSGSTGTPKGVCLSESNQWQVAQSVARVVNEASDVQRHLCLLPLSTLLENVAGLYGALLSGAEVFLPNATERGLSGSNGLSVSRMLACLDRTAPHSLILIPQLLTVLVQAADQDWQPP